MKFIVKLFPEIMMKSRPVRNRFSKILQGNIRNVLTRHDEQVKVILEWDKIIVRTENESAENKANLILLLSSTPGIAHFLEVTESVYTDLHDVYEQTLAMVGDSLDGKTFCVRIKRIGKHDFSSIDAERYVGGGLNQHTDTLGVKLKGPEITINLEINNEKLFFIDKKHPGLGGFPLGTQESVLSLISGGFDSGVSSYKLIKRGSRVHYCFFNLGGGAHEIGVKQVAYQLWNRFGSSHRVKFISIPFEPVVAEILEKVENGQMGVVLKRMMMRAATLMAERLGVEALITGEALGQVSSQTLRNLSVIDKVSDMLILRPLIATDKQDIVDCARVIGTAEISETIPEYCGVISQRPTVKAVMRKIEKQEEKFDLSLIEQVVNQAPTIDIRDIAKAVHKEILEVESVSQFAENEIVLDIRSLDEAEESPLDIEGVTIEHLPFFKLSNQFETLPQDKIYLLYCARGVMSKLQALYLKESGFDNVKVYRP
ncbi:[ThiS-adenylate] sulfurtransferase [Psychromonas ingrahamii 37]|uniref:tRNA sulfurtransferase n=1 Tax=Psychromonas ingrahamii (strain DSM 17664 / CCUG 51855 / 37) TaxID=357804 RepID=THII_PSYIN|nr:tRNA uracil 4-sulfurtransferase ThiI [Psychromonas ingrahamii]A1SWV3.1 RecName: Full=tRNA sulfurtransferase; AltName: Full=Sulfur carrier protein ThiS sulfurtransferase; AltName: Full=Thiamine biosynthesis protein ThiI; AltName: Full=tRNA 4-thiouridine synthase [Psychromonas ingrahamii 37]ABM03968.1 [ThiS-adenylate] sulfurtransferase [Psychromonas ingrahamii 37]